MLNRILFDRRPILAQIADKVRVRFYLEVRLGSAILPSLYYLTSDSKTIPFDSLPDRFVVKSTHGSGWVQIVRDKASLNRQQLIETCNDWLSQNYYDIAMEWAYKNLEPKILIEELVEGNKSDTPDDYKFFVFGGKVRLIQFDQGRFTEHRRNLYIPEWNKINSLLEHEGIVEDVLPPRHLTTIIKAAEILGEGMDFIRADFYNTGKRIYLGELTGTPGAGTDRFIPQELDYEFGKFWKLERQS